MRRHLLTVAAVAAVALGGCGDSGGGANPKAVQEFMGHSKIQTTFDTYGHLFPGSHDEVRLRMDAYLTAAAEMAAAAA